MTTMASTVGAPSTKSITWTSIKWRTVEEFVYKLQTRIAKAIQLILPSRSISKNESLSIERLKIAGLLSIASEELEPYDGKLSRTVLRGARYSNVARLLDRTLGGPGLLESIYESALCHELIYRHLC